MDIFFDPYSDYGFKKLFGEEGSKDILIDFLNTMLPEHHQITELAFSDKEIVPASVMDRKGSYDIYCTAVNQDRFIVEMQKARFPTFKERALIYSVWSLQNQIKRGEDWKKKKRFAAIYFVGILNFVFKEELDDNGVPIPNKLYTNVRLRDDDCTLFYSGLTMKFLQMPLFKKTENELETRFDKWLYFLKNLPSFDHIPRILNEPVFSHAFDIAKLGNMVLEEREAYDKSVMDTLAYFGAIEDGREDGKEEGRIEGRIEGQLKGKIEVVMNMKAEGFSVEMISRLTKFPAEEIERLLHEQ
ncbi:MAG: Rpn family recombination-promoting nuclease/putative transposase [Planctomycetaceae bacterium]|jgi:predicted transposase/invertase (TIGR01784 family)|nr:Rpn family recombination-promoting nuclease/putative transposase [Planctomycetaceae bacterium]